MTIRKAVTTLVLSYVCLSIFMVTALTMLGSQIDYVMPWAIMLLSSIVAGAVLTYLGILDLD